MSEDPPAPATRRTLAVIALAALAVRLYIHALSPTIAGDSAFYLWTADLMRRGDFAGALALWGLHPLYPFLTSLVGRIIPDLALAAVAISFAASTAVVWPLHALFRLLWSDRAASAACLLYALHPILAPETSDALPTALQLLCFVSALACGLRAFRGGPWILYPAAGACAALAYLSRTEGLLAGPLLLAAAGVAVIRRPPGFQARRFALGVAAALLAGLILAGPYIAHLSHNAGRFAITAKGGGTVLLHAMRGDAGVLPGETGRWAYLPTIGRKMSYAFFAPLLPFLLAGLYLERGETRRRLGHLLAAAAVLAPPILLFALHRHFRPSHRYFLTGVTLLLPWTAAGMLATLDLLRRRFPATPLPAALGAALLLALLVGKNVPPHRPEQSVYREAGAWLAENPPARPWRLVSSSDKLSWYAGAEHVSFRIPATSDPAAAAAELCRMTKAHLLALDGITLDELGGPGVAELLERAGFVPVRAFEGKLIVRLWRPPP